MPLLVIESRCRLERHPKLALYERNPWASVIGSEIPSVVVYADGSVISRRATGLVEGRVADGWIQRSVYGMAPECRPVSRATAPANGFEASCVALRDLKLSGKHAYEPANLEVMLWGYDHSPETPKSTSRR